MYQLPICNMKVTILKGLPASGKSTWAKSQCDNNTIRINKDDLRNMLGGDFSKWKESLVLELRDRIIQESLDSGKNVIVDDTNFHPKHEERIRDIAKLFDVEVEIKMFDTPVEECIKRDQKRDKPVGKSVIMDMYRKYVKKIPEQIPYNNLLPDCVIVDIDGTLAHMTNRSPYDYTKVDTDVVDETIKMILQPYEIRPNTKIIVCSGRKEECSKETVKWLNDNGIKFDDLFMRFTDDLRKDSIVKQEIYEMCIKDKYNVLFVLDDRDQVVNMWREQGLKCLQVAEGNF